MPYSGPASACGIIGKTMSAYFRMIKHNGGINGRKTAHNTSTAPIEVLKHCGDNLARENVMKVVANMDFEISTFIPGIASRLADGFLSDRAGADDEIQRRELAAVRADPRRPRGVGD